MSKQKSVGYSPYFLTFGRDPIFQSRHQPLVKLTSDPSDEEMRIFLNDRGQTFKRVMPLAMRNLAIALQRDMEWYRHVRGQGWDRPKASFSPGDYILLKQETAHSLEPLAYSHVLRNVEIRPTGIAILEGSDAARCSRQLKDVAHCPLPILDTNLYPGRYYRGPHNASNTLRSVRSALSCLRKLENNICHVVYAYGLGSCSREGVQCGCS